MYFLHSLHPCLSAYCDLCLQDRVDLIHLVDSVIRMSMMTYAFERPSCVGVANPRMLKDGSVLLDIEHLPKQSSVIIHRFSPLPGKGFFGEYFKRRLEAAAGIHPVFY